MERDREKNLVITGTMGYLLAALAPALIALIGFLLIGIDGLKTGLGFSDWFRGFCKEIAQIAPHFPPFIALIPVCYKLLLLAGACISLLRCLDIGWGKPLYFFLFVICGMFTTFMFLYEVTHIFSTSARYAILAWFLVVAGRLVHLAIVLILLVLRTRWGTERNKDN